MTKATLILILVVVIFFGIRWSQIYGKIKTSKDFTSPERQVIIRQLIAETMVLLSLFTNHLLQAIGLSTLLSSVTYWVFFFAIWYIALSSIRNRISTISGKGGPMIVKGRAAIINGLLVLVIIVLVQGFFYFWW